MICAICKRAIVNGGFGFNWENVAGFLKGRHDIEAHASCALDKFNASEFTTVEAWVRAEFWTHFLSIGE